MDLSLSQSPSRTSNFTNSAPEKEPLSSPFDTHKQEAYYISNAESYKLTSQYNYDYYISQYLKNAAFIHVSSDQLSVPFASTSIENERRCTDSSLLSVSKDYEEQLLLKQHGYRQEDILCDTVQGQLLKCRVMTDSKIQKNPEYVAIKRTDKELFKQKITKQCGFSFCIEENIIKEAQILKYLTIDNHSSEYIVKYIGFFESESDYYLIMEYIEGQMNLKEFVEKAHRFIVDGKLELKHYQKIIKYIFWQLTAVIYWLHHDMNCCHLDLCLENVMIKNGDFIIAEDGSVTINGSISVKLCDFGCSEIFKPEKNGRFKCVKSGSVLGDIQYQSPQMIEECVYDGSKSDIWSLGMMLFHCIVGYALYDKINDKEGSGYWAVINNKINEYILMNNLKQKINVKLSSLLVHLIHINEKKRFTAFEILQHRWFKTYFKRYHQQIEKKSIKLEKKMTNDIAYYSYSN